MADEMVAPSVLTFLSIVIEYVCFRVWARHCSASL